MSFKITYAASYYLSITTLVLLLLLKYGDVLIKKLSIFVFLFNSNLRMSLLHLFDVLLRPNSNDIWLVKVVIKL